VNCTEFIQAALTEFHRTINTDVKDLTPEHLAFRPASGANPIGFIFWHITRTEDMIIHRFLGKPSIWESGNWQEKMGMPAPPKGGGHPEEEIAKAGTLPLPQVLAYAELVYKDTNEYLKTLDDQKLDFAPNAERPQFTIGMMLRNFLITHGWWHLGEIKFLKGLQGMPAPM